MFLTSAIYLFTEEIYFSSIILSIVISLFAILLFTFKIAKSTSSALIGITVLTFSKAFIDYSTSGLENPLTHLILALFLFVYFTFEINSKTLFLMSLIAAFGVFNRMDTILLFLPVLLYSLWRLYKWKEGLCVVFVGFSPFILWECFSLFYYGSPFPNTAYAKLNTGISGIKLANQGIYYLWNSIKLDPLTLLTVITGITIPFLTREWRNLPVVVGIVFYLLYVIKIGGDFMSGRFLTAPLFCAIIVLSRCHSITLKSIWLLAFITIVLIGLKSPYPPPLSNSNYPGQFKGWIENWMDKGIAEERGGYYQTSGLIKAKRDIEMPTHPWATEGRLARINRVQFAVRGTVGFFGFFAGPHVYVIDVFALADPLLARLPIPKNSNRRIDHSNRKIPPGYMLSLFTGQNCIKDKNLAAYYDKLFLITRGKLFDWERLVAIWNINMGNYNTYIKAYLN